MTTRPEHHSDSGEHPLLQQAPVVPLDASGFTAAVVGTGACLAVTVVYWLSGHGGQWGQILVTATAFGLFLIGFTAWTRWGRRSATPPPVSGDDAADRSG